MPHFSPKPFIAKPSSSKNTNSNADHSTHKGLQTLPSVFFFFLLYKLCTVVPSLLIEVVLNVR